MLRQKLMHSDHISYAHSWEVAIPLLARSRVQRQRTRSAVVRAEEVGTHREVLFGVEETTLLHRVRPPVGNIGVSRQGVAHPYNVGVVAVTNTEGVIGNLKRGQHLTRLQSKWFIVFIYLSHKYLQDYSAAANACSKSSIISSTFSSPSEMRNRVGVTPAAFKSASESCLWVVDAG